jgi:hypothetical protein
LPYTKVDYLNIKNPKVIDADGSEWRNISTDPVSFNKDFHYDGVIINNVIDYGARVENPEPHTVYECIDNS